MTPEVIALIGALGGTLLGTAGTLGAQLIAARRESAAERRARQREHLVDLQKAIVDFHAAVHMAREAADHYDKDVRAKGKAYADLWATRRAMTLIGPESLDEPSRQLARTAEDLLWEPFEGFASPHLVEPMARFEAVVKPLIRDYQVRVGIEA